MHTRFHVRLPDETLATLDRLAQDHDISRTAVIRRALALLDQVDHRPEGHYVGFSPNRPALSHILCGAR